MNTPKWIVTLTLAFALSIQTLSVSAATTMITLTLPSPNPGLIGDDINFALMVNVTDMNPGVAGIDIYLTYDPVYVTPSSSPLGVVEPLPDFFGPSNITWYEKFPGNQCPAGGALPCIHLVAAGPAQVTHSGAVARFHFQGIAITPAAGAVFTVLAPIKMVDSDGFPVAPAPVAPGPQIVQIVNRMVTGTVLRQGTPANPNPGGGTLACSAVKLIDSGGVTFGPVFTDINGKFTITNPPSGVQKLRAEYPGYLYSEKTITFSTGGPSSINVGITTLRGGDVKGDNKVNILDVGTIISRFNTSAFVGSVNPATCGADDPVDINDNGKVDISDLGLLYGANFGLVGPTIWP